MAAPADSLLLCYQYLLERAEERLAIDDGAGGVVVMEETAEDESEQAEVEKGT